MENVVRAVVQLERRIDTAYRDLVESGVAALERQIETAIRHSNRRSQPDKSNDSVGSSTQHHSSIGSTKRMSLSSTSGCRR